MRLIIVVAIALGISGCASLQHGWDVLTSTQVSPQLVSVAGNSFDALEATATNYLKLTKCTGNNNPICRDPAITKRIISAVRTGRVARANLEQFFHDHPGQLGPAGLYDAMTAAIATLQTELVRAH